MHASSEPVPHESVLQLRTPGRILLWLLAFLPALLCGLEIREHAVDVPVWDDWERAQLLEKYYAGELDLRYLASAHIDHRPLVPRLLTLALNAVTRGDLRAEMWVGFSAVLGAAVLLAIVVSRALPAGPWRWGTVFCLNLFLFSPVQYQNFLWGTQMAYLLPTLFLCLSLWGMGSPRLRPVGKFFVGAMAATLATYSFGHGIVVWPVVVCMALLAREGQSLSSRLLLAGGLAAAAAVVMAIYFNWNYVNSSHPAHAFGAEPGQRPPGLQNLEQTLGTGDGRERVKRYFLTSLGNPYARVFQSDPAEAARSLGGWALVLFAGLVVWGFWRGRAAGDFNALLPWLAAGGFAVSNAFLQALGRAAISSNRAILPRYISSTQFLGIAIVGGGALLLHRWCRSAEDGEARVRREGLAVALGLALVALQVPSWSYGRHKMAAWEGARLQEQFALSYMNLRDPDSPSRIDKETAMPLVQRGIAVMEERGLLGFPVLDEWGWGDVEALDRDLPKSRADIWRAVMSDNGLLAIEGWAEFGGDDNRPADGMVFTYRKAGGAQWEVFDVLETNPLVAPRAWIADGHFGAPKPSYSKKKNVVGWGGFLRLPQFAESGVIEIKAWAVDRDKRQAVGLKQILRIAPGVRPGVVLIDKAKPVAGPQPEAEG